MSPEEKRLPRFSPELRARRQELAAEYSLLSPEEKQHVQLNAKRQVALKRVCLLYTSPSPRD
eukprot:3659173-Alexandrium_andersonii.AAC.1